MATSNFLQHDLNKNNIQNDGDFLASSIREDGIISGRASSIYFNKLLYQLSTMIAALGQAMANKGYTVSDTNLTTLITALENLMTLADMTDYPTNDEMAAYVISKIPIMDFTNLKSTNGYQKLPGGLILQWGQTTIPPSGGSTWYFPIPFPTACISGVVTHSGDLNAEIPVFISKSKTAASVDSSPGINTVTVTIWVIGY